MLHKWQEIQGKGATCASLIATATEAGNMDLAHYVQSLQETIDQELIELAPSNDMLIQIFSMIITTDMFHSENN